MTTRIKAHSTISWAACGKYTDIQYHKAEGIAKITINR
ncbi:MAG TPA: 1,4-dihydroxy-2-naphthoyl-CoA synthase, partial [Candidatus Omnitrophica bacterium]|nr:1,4-dihydroxy-2-naphthoyl-CoA synthase [Candidatus Omnitrophota bacterium]